MRWLPLKELFRNYLNAERSVLNRYVCSLALLGVGFAGMLGLRELEDARIYSLMLMAAVLAAVHGGLGPALVVSLIGSLLLDYFFVPPMNQIFDSVNSYVRIVGYGLSSALISGVVAVVRDCLIETEQFKEVATRASREKDRLMATISHDVKNPLGVIRGFAEIIRSKYSDQELLRLINIIEKNCSLTIELINDLQDLSSLGHPDFKPSPGIMDLGSLVREIIVSLEPLSSRKSIDIVLEKSSEPALVRADKRLIRRAIQNLIDNAIKYSPKHSVVRVGIRRHLGSASIMVIDQGDGIAPEEQNKIFSPFYRAKSRPTAGESSTGLGLATVATIADVHRGSVSVESVLGQGSTFTFTLPTDGIIEAGELDNGEVLTNPVHDHPA